MCFDKDSSLLAWTLSYTIAWYLFNRNKNFDRWNAGFIIAFATIQVLEAGLWANNDDGKNPDINGVLTKLILLTLVFQPFFQTYLGYKYTKSNLLKMMTFIYVGIIMWTLMRLWKSKQGQFSSAPGPNGHMVWTDSAKPNDFLGGKMIGLLYFIGLFLPLLYMTGYGGRGAFLIAIGVITAIYSMIFAGGKEFSSYWCFSAVAYSIASIFV